MSQVPTHIETLLLSLTKQIRPDAKWLRSKVLFDLGRDGAWSMTLDSGRAAVSATAVPRPDLTIRCDAAVLATIMTGKRPGFEFFLEGQLEARGNIGLALELESLFVRQDEEDPSYPKTIHPQAGNIRWSMLAAGPVNAPPVLLLHGLGSSKMSMLTTLSALRNEYRVYACDLPGFGNSSKPRAPYDSNWYAAKTIEVMDELGIRKAALIGNSMGGRIAVECALAHPERVSGLVLYGPALAYMHARVLLPLVRYVLPELSLLPLSPSRRRVMGSLRAIFADPHALAESWVEAATDEFLRVYSKPFGRLAFYTAAKAIYLDDPTLGMVSRLRHLSVPAQFIFGRNDPLIPSELATVVADEAPDSRIAVLDNCGHVPQLEFPDKTHRLTRKLLSDVYSVKDTVA